jgi:DNA-binding winged helix-turn-helix (wHTH) protein
MPDAAAGRPRYRFGAFELSPAQRQLRRDGVEVRLIPRYFDLLLLLVDERHRAVHRQEIFDRVWSDVIVSDGALSQAVRTLRRTLGDDPREPQFIRTVSRHGYQFVCLEVAVVNDVEAAVPQLAAPAPDTPATEVDRFGPLLDRLLKRGDGLHATDEERLDAAQQLHVLGTAEALSRLDRLPGHAEARALLRDARWDVPGAGDVPLLGAEGWPASALALMRFRLRRAARLVSSRWVFASAGGALAGAIAGALGGLTLLFVPTSHAAPSIVAALAVVGIVAGALAAAGIGAGLTAAEALARSQRPWALVGCGALGGGLVGFAAHHLARSVMGGLFGHDVAGIGGGVEGLVLGAAAGAGYAMATPRLPGGGLATPRGLARLQVSVITGIACGVAGLVLSLAGRRLVAASLDVMADAFSGSATGLAPLALLIGEQSVRPVTQTLISVFEGLAFGAGLAYGLTHRPGPTDR